jgi:predicted transcriptional regulator
MNQINLTEYKKLREKKGLSLTALAKMAGISWATLSRMEERGETTEKTVKKIAGSLSADVHTLIKGGIQEEGKPADRIEMVEKGTTYIKEEEEGTKISNLLTRAAEVLESGSIFRQALVANINAFHQAVRTAEKNQALQARVDHLESRLAAVEEKLKGA